MQLLDLKATAEQKELADRLTAAQKEIEEVCNKHDVAIIAQPVFHIQIVPKQKQVKK